MSADWNETKSLLLEVEQLFNRDDDVRDIYDIKKMADEIRMHQANNLKSAKEIIKEMTTEVAAREAAVMAPSSVSAYLIDMIGRMKLRAHCLHMLCLSCAEIFSQLTIKTSFPFSHSCHLHLSDCITLNIPLYLHCRLSILQTWKSL
jgi:hypothetical protein